MATSFDNVGAASHAEFVVNTEYGDWYLAHHAPQGHPAPIVRPGSRTDSDPDYLLETLTADDVEELLHTLMRCREAMATTHFKPGRAMPRTDYVFTEWERNLIWELDRRYVSRLRKGYDRFPLSGVQLVWLKFLHEKAALAVRRTMEGMPG